MEQTTLQQRIEERATNKLLLTLKQAHDKELEIVSLLGVDGKNYQIYKPLLSVTLHNRANHYGERYDRITLHNDYTKELFNKLLPQYITLVTDEILRKIDEIEENYEI